MERVAKEVYIKLLFVLGGKNARRWMDVYAARYYAWGFRAEMTMTRMWSMWSGRVSGRDFLL